MKIKSLVISALSIAVGIAGFVFMEEARKQQSETDALIALTAQTAAPQPRKKIWIGADECKTTFGPNTVAFCDGVAKDNSLYLDSGADAAVKKCFEYTAEKIGRPVSAAQDIACEVKMAYGDRQFEYDSEKDTPGIKNNNYNILNEWVNR